MKNIFKNKWFWIILVLIVLVIAYQKGLIFSPKATEASDMAEAGQRPAVHDPTVYADPVDSIINTKPGAGTTQR